MAIGKITKGNGFYGVMNYLLDKDKNPEIIGGCMVGEEADDIAREFRQIANLRPGVEKPVRHFSISFSPNDGHVDNIVKEAIAYRVLDALGHRNCQFIAIGHDRAQKNHDEVHDHDHMHIVTNGVTTNGQYVHDRFDRYKIQKILRKVEIEFELHQIQSSWEIKNEKGMEVERSSEIAKLVATSLEDKPSLSEWLDRLAVDKIDVRFNLTNKDVVQGVSFIKDGEAYKGSSIGAKWSKYTGTKKPSNLDENCSIVSEIVQCSPQDVPLMKAANQKSQQHPVRLDEVDRAMFDRAVEMAEMAVFHQGRNGKFRNGRVEIAIDEDRMKVRRVRPEKIMLEATKVDGEWQVVGFPNIIKVDVQLLERVNGAEGMDFKAIVVERGASSEQKASPQLLQPSVEGMEIEEVTNFPDDDDAALVDRIGTTPKIRLQAAIDWAAEEATYTVLEFTEYLAQRGVKTRITDSANGEIEITYQLEGVDFEATQLTDASLSLLKSARDLTFDRLNDLDRINEIKVDSDIEDFAPPTWAEIEEEGKAVDRSTAETLVQTEEILNSENIMVTRRTLNNLERLYNSKDYQKGKNKDTIQSRLGAIQVAKVEHLTLLRIDNPKLKAPDANELTASVLMQAEDINNINNADRLRIIQDKEDEKLELKQEQSRGLGRSL